MDRGIFAVVECEIACRNEALDHEFDVIDRFLRVEAVGGELVEMEGFHALVGRTFEDLGDEVDAVALAHAVDAGENFLRVNRDIDVNGAGFAVAAVVASGAAVGGTKIVEDEAPQAFGRVAVVDHALELLRLDAPPLLVLGRDVDEIALRARVLW